MHAYIYLKLRHLVSSPFRRRVGALFLILMVLVPVCVRMAENKGFADLSAVIAWIGFSWMGFAFILIVALGLFDLWLLVMRLRQACGGEQVSDIMRMRGLRSALIAAIICTGYGFCEALVFRTEHLIIRSPKIPADAGRIRVVQLSDVHLGVMIGKWRLARMLEVVSAAKPDILVATGDVVDGQIHRMNGLSGMLKAIAPRYGSFAVLGNHEFYVGLENSIAFLQASGFRILRKDSADILPYLRIAGVDDAAGHGWGQKKDSDERDLLPNSGNRPYTVLLKHRPAVNPDSAGRFDIQLSGHVHKGQIFPFNVLTWFSFPVSAGVNRFADNSILYVSRGTGTWGPPIRFLAPPEVTIIDILPETKP